MTETGYDKITTWYLDNEKASEQFGAQLASYLSAPLVITLSGDIGVGKTTIIRSLLRNLGIQSAIKSPTFSLVESYFCQGLHVHHFDLYRIHNEEELEYIGFRDYFSNDNVCCIEWAEHAGKTLPPADIRFNLSIKGAGRELQIIASSSAGKRIMASLADKR
jgi:tRNA threonylcarbamoyladenosine biosynthesis protein TsaE